MNVTDIIQDRGMKKLVKQVEDNTGEINKILKEIEKLIIMMNARIYKGANKYAHDSHQLTTRQKLTNKLGITKNRKKAKEAKYKPGRKPSD